MNIRPFLFAAGILALASCGNATKNNVADSTDVNDTALAIHANSATSLDVQPLSGYFVKNTVKVTDSLTFWVIDNQASFDSLFGMAKTMDNKIDQPDFGTHIVVAATMPPTFYNTQIQLASATIDDLNNNASLHFVAQAAKEKNSSSIVPLWLGSIPKTGKTAINFYTGDHLTKTVSENE